MLSLLDVNYFPSTAIFAGSFKIYIHTFPKTLLILFPNVADLPGSTTIMSKTFFISRHLKTPFLESFKSSSRLLLFSLGERFLRCIDWRSKGTALMVTGF